MGRNGAGEPDSYEQTMELLIPQNIKWRGSRPGYGEGWSSSSDRMQSFPEPRPSRGFHELMETLEPDGSWIVAPVEERYEFKKNIWVCPLDQVSL